MTQYNYVAIDISKHTLAVKTDKVFSNFSYTAKGLEDLIAFIGEIPRPLVVAEPTAGYERPLVERLCKAHIPHALISPQRIRGFAQSEGIKAKTDPLDARLILKFAQAKQPKPRVLPSAQRKLLAELMDRRTQLSDFLAMEKNHLEKASSAMRKKIQITLRHLTKQIENIEAEIQALIKSDTDMKRQSDTLQTVKGVGPVTAWTVLAYLNEITTLNRNQLTALVGLAPYNRDSGTERGKRFIQGGRQKIRDCLYMATRTAATHNPHIKAYCDRLKARGKPYKCYMVAAMRKLILHMQSILKNLENALA